MRLKDKENYNVHITKCAKSLQYLIKSVHKLIISKSTEFRKLVLKQS